MFNYISENKLSGNGNVIYIDQPSLKEAFYFQSFIYRIFELRLWPILAWISSGNATSLDLCCIDSVLFKCQGSLALRHAERFWQYISPCCWVNILWRSIEAVIQHFLRTPWEQVLLSSSTYKMSSVRRSSWWIMNNIHSILLFERLTEGVIARSCSTSRHRQRCGCRRWELPHSGGCNVLSGKRNARTKWMWNRSMLWLVGIMRCLNHNWIHHSRIHTIR